MGFGLINHCYLLIPVNELRYNKLKIKRLKN